MRLTSTDTKNICQTLMNVKEMLKRQQVIDLGAMAFWDLIGLEGHVEPDYPGSQAIYHALSYAIDLKRIRVKPPSAEGYDYVDDYLRQLPLRTKKPTLSNGGCSVSGGVACGSRQSISDSLLTGGVESRCSIRRTMRVMRCMRICTTNIPRLITTSMLRI